VAAAIVAAGHNVSADIDAGPSVLRRGAWRWKYSDGSIERTAPKWTVTIEDDRCPEDGGMRGHGVAASPRRATLEALQHLAARGADRAAAWSAKSKRCRIERHKASCADAAHEWLTKSVDVRALAAQVAAMWPEVTP
jgi:hypothetical protein